MTRWNYGDETITTLANQTQGSGEELTSLIKELVEAAEPLRDKFSGPGAAAFNDFKERSDEITADLNAGLSRINEGQGEMNAAFRTGEQTMVDDSEKNMASANFDAAKFR